MAKLERKKCLLIVPVNDEEAYTIAELGEKIGMQVYRSRQPHGARLEEEPGILDLIRSCGCDTVVTVELPGPEVEEQIRSLGKDLTIIDHHRYTDLDRARDSATGKLLPSSLEQFLDLAGLDDAELKELGYQPRLVRAVGLWDAGYIWALIKAGYSRDEIEAFERHKAELERRIGIPSATAASRQAAEQAWQDRQQWNGYTIVTADDPKAHIRSLVSRMAAKEFWKPTPMLISERGGQRLYAQETPSALALYENFGGFTFGGDQNWGYDSLDEGKEIKLQQIKVFLSNLTS